MSGGYLWVVQGVASGRPVYGSTNKYMVINRMKLLSVDKFRVFRLQENGGKVIEVCVHCLLENPEMPAQKKGHADGSDVAR